jgi:hypothetical protein
VKELWEKITSLAEFISEDGFPSKTGNSCDGFPSDMNQSRTQSMPVRRLGAGHTLGTRLDMNMKRKPSDG